jgi:hypothetical protein
MKIAVFGMGSSLSEFVKEDYCLSIGVNDIWQFVNTDVVVCLDPFKNFNHERLKVIQECKPEAFYSQIVNWDIHSNFKKIDIAPGYPDTYCNLNVPAFQKSYCSPFVAVQIAWKIYGATEIHLFGVDLINHPHLDRKLCDKIKMHFRHLKTALTEKECQLIVHGEGILKDL